MMKFITAVAAAFIVAVLSTAAFAQEYRWPESYVVQTMFGSRLSFSGTATHETWNFGMQSRYVRICTDDQSAVRYIRLGHTITASTDETTGDSTGMKIYAPTTAEFRNGTTMNRGSAIPLTPGGDLTDRLCFTFPWQTRGVSINASPQAGGTAINTDVWVFPLR